MPLTVLPRRARLVRTAATLSVLAGTALLLAAAPAGAQSLSLDLGPGGGLTERAMQLVALITILSVAPSIVIMVTAFTRIVVVLSLLRTALGTQSSPPNFVIVSLAVFLTGFVMAPTVRVAYSTAIQPLIANQIQPAQAFERGVVPFRDFMMRQVRENA